MKIKDASKYIKIFNKCNRFENIYNIAEDMTKKEKGDLLEIITYYLFLLSPLLNTGIQNVWLYDDIPENLLKSLNLPKKDKGVDLIIQRDDKYLAVQSKYRQDRNATVCWDEMATFYGLSFGVGMKWPLFMVFRSVLARKYLMDILLQTLLICVKKLTNAKR